jgi:hypothetical protein
MRSKQQRQGQYQEQALYGAMARTNDDAPLLSVMASGPHCVHGSASPGVPQSHPATDAPYLRWGLMSFSG